MAYDELLVERIQNFFDRQIVKAEVKKMMGGLCFMVDAKMCCGTHIDKASKQSFLMARVGPEAAEKYLDLPHVMPMNFTGRPMKGFLFVEELGLSTEAELDFWLSKCLAFNPQAKSSKKKDK